MNKRMRNFEIWSDKWWIENNKAWFVSGEDNILFETDLLNGTIKPLSRVPNARGFRWNPECMKKGEDILCFPNRGTKLWIFSITSKEWEEVEFEKNVDKRLMCQFLCVVDRSVWFVSRGLCKIYRYDLVTKHVRSYTLKGEMPTYESVSNGVVVENKILFAGIGTNNIICFDMDSKQLFLKKVDVLDEFMRIQKIGNDLYIVGLKKAVYVWNYIEDTVTTINEFPENFGIYTKQKNRTYKKDCFNKKGESPLFGIPIESEDNIWLIPWIGTDILVIDRKTKEIEVFEIKEEEAQYLHEHIQGCKYLFNYIRDNQFIGLFSMKNRCQLEIDMKRKRIRYLTMDVFTDEWNKNFGFAERSKYDLDGFIHYVLSK